MHCIKKYSIKKYTSIILIICNIFICSSSIAFAVEEWIAEFDYLCGKTDESLNLKIEELQQLVDRCDKLKTLIENSEHPQKKIYLKRLENCRKLFIYMISVREKQK